MRSINGSLKQKHLMTLQNRGNVSSAKKTATTPIWNSYLAIRSSTPRNVASNAANDVNQSTCNGNRRVRNRAKPFFCRVEVHGVGIGIWRTLGTPLAQCSGSEDVDAVLTGIRTYWMQLSVNERQQILLVDDPELVKQLYKVNLSLLCVGLVQRHLKTTNRTATITTRINEKVVGATMAKEASSSAINCTGMTYCLASLPTCAVIDASLEKAYELLEAMEFMDIGTGILTVKTELAEATDRLFTLVGDVLTGFLTSLHVLTESNFMKLFVMESETIKTWANYQRLIAMLLEQLILRSYISHLEKEAAHRMEELLQEVSLEDQATGNVGKSLLYRNKKKKTKKTKAPTALANTTKDHYITEAAPAGSSDRILHDGLAHVSDETMMEKPFADMMHKSKVKSDCQSNSSTALTDDGIVEDQNAVPAEVGPLVKEWSRLNPNALVFQPQGSGLAVEEDIKGRTPLAGKRKLDDYIVSVPWDDIESDAGSTIDSGPCDRDLFDIENEVHDKGAQHQWRRKQRRLEETAELEWQLQQVYASTSSLYGWDFLRQCALPDPVVNLPWSERTLMRTAPKEVVRFFSSNMNDSYANFRTPHYIPTTARASMSRYYIYPMPFGPSLLPELIPAHFHGNVGFQNAELCSMVVSSPDFTYAQYHLRKHEDQGDFQEMLE